MCSNHHINISTLHYSILCSWYWTLKVFSIDIIKGFILRNWPCYYINPRFAFFCIYNFYAQHLTIRTFLSTIFFPYYITSGSSSSGPAHSILPYIVPLKEPPDKTGPDTSSPQFSHMYAAPNIVHNTPLPGTCPIPYYVTPDTPSRSSSSMISTKYTDTHPTIPSNYLAPSFKSFVTIIYICFTDHLSRTYPTEYPGPNTSSPISSDTRKVPSLSPKSPPSLAPKQTSSDPTS